MQFKQKLINLLTPEAFRQEHIFWTFWRSSAWKRAKLALIYSKRQLQHGSMLFFPLALRSTTFLLGHVQRSKCRENVLHISLQAFLFFNFFLHLSFFSFSYLFAAVIVLLLCLFPVQKINSEKA